MRFLIFCCLILFLFPDSFAQNNQIGFRINWAGRHANYPLYLPPNASDLNKSVLKNKFIYYSRDKNSTLSRWQFFDAGITFKRQIKEGNYFWRADLSYFYFKNNNDITQILVNETYNSINEIEYKAYEFAPGIGREFREDRKLNFQIGLVLPFHMSINNKEKYLDQPLQLYSNNVDVFMDIYTSYPNGYYLGLEAFYNVGIDLGKQFTVLFEMTSGFYYYWIQDDTVLRFEEYDTASGTSPKEVTDTRLLAKESGFKSDLLNNFSLHFLYSF